MKYRIEQSLSRQDSFDGCEPLRTEHANSLPSAREMMLQLAESGAFYAAVFLDGPGTDTGECVMETEDVI